MSFPPTTAVPRITVILSTYNSPSLLENCLTGFMAQDWEDFEVLVADDGSTGETLSLIEDFAKRVSFPIHHHWHPDEGFRKTVILNRAIAAAEGEYLIFTDGDCIPRADFVRVHARHAASGIFLSAGVEYLSAGGTAKLTPDTILDQTIFDPHWLSGKRERAHLFGKVNRSSIVRSLARWTSLTRPTFNGHNSSAWKRDILAANGFDERMEYGGLDRELGERLVNNGIRGHSVRHDAICIHQFHDRPYATPEGREANLKIRDEVRRKRLTRSPFGITKES